MESPRYVVECFHGFVPFLFAVVHGMGSHATYRQTSRWSSLPQVSASPLMEDPSPSTALAPGHDAGSAYFLMWSSMSL